ncbi:hypothetical protein J3F83DRAFT_245631 [Trichoderma novae-zelandiae]
MQPSRPNSPSCCSTTTILAMFFFLSLVAPFLSPHFVLALISYLLLLLLFVFYFSLFQTFNSISHETVLVGALKSFIFVRASWMWWLSVAKVAYEVRASEFFAICSCLPGVFLAVWNNKLKKTISPPGFYMLPPFRFSSFRFDKRLMWSAVKNGGEILSILAYTGVAKG